MSVGIAVLANMGFVKIGFNGTPESKERETANQKAWPWDGAACIAEERVEEIVDSRAKVVCAYCEERVTIYMVSG